MTEVSPIRCRRYRRVRLFGTSQLQTTRSTLRGIYELAVWRALSGICSLSLAPTVWLQQKVVQLLAGQHTELVSSAGFSPGLDPCRKPFVAPDPRQTMSDGLPPSQTLPFPGSVLIRLRSCLGRHESPVVNLKRSPCNHGFVTRDRLIDVATIALDWRSWS
jgi:hypothetical protein